MNTKQAHIDGLIIIDPVIHKDSRGMFWEAWQAERYAEHGIDDTFVQDNISYSRRDVLRGLHFQQPYGQGKLVQVLEGEVLDIAVDLRFGSPTFGQWVAVLLSSKNRRQMYIPEGFAHGFCVTSEEALFSYKCTRYYNPDTEHGLLWNDPAINIQWPTDSPLISEKDAQAKMLSEYGKDELPQYKG